MLDIFTKYFVDAAQPTYLGYNVEQDRYTVHFDIDGAKKNLKWTNITHVGELAEKRTELEQSKWAEDQEKATVKRKETALERLRQQAA